MRGKIIADLAEHYSATINEIHNLIINCVTISEYSTKIIKDKKVINKINIPKNEQIVLDYYKSLINRYGHIRYPNRSYIMTELMNVMPYLTNYNAYTIYKFDFKDFFYNISSSKSVEYICNSIDLKTNEVKFLKDYTKNNSELCPGIGLHNALVEMCGKYFDIEVKKKLKDYGYIYYARYVDDCILILDEIVSKDVIDKIISVSMKKCFGTRLKLNPDKSKFYHSKDTNYYIDYLGYVFEKGQSMKKPFKFGIAEQKLEKYEEKVEKIILEFKQTNDIELLSFKLGLLFKRIVYYGDRKNDGKYKWQVRGLSDSYKELRRFIKTNDDLKKITRETQHLFEKKIIISFRKNRMTIPPKINNQLQNKKFISCFLKNNALLLHPKIGLSSAELKKRLCVVYTGDFENYDYNQLASQLLKSIK